MKKTIYLIAALALTLVSCNDYLDTVQSKGNDEVLTTSKQVEALFANSDIFNTSATLNLYASDDYGLTTDIYDMLGYVDENIINGMTWNVTDVAANQYGDNAWDTEYSKVFTANLIITSIDEIKDLTEANRTEYLAQAHMMRATAMWNLVNTYCLPYSAETAGSPGLPLKTTTSYEEDVTRATLQQTYDFILDDLKEAEKTNNTGIAANKRWAVSKPAVEALMARFYLFTQDYATAAQYATEALKCSDAQLDDYNELGFRPAEVALDGEMQTVNYSPLYRYGDNQVANYKENYLSQYFSCNNTLIPSESLISLYDQDTDLRFKQFFNKYALWEEGIGGFGDDILYHKFYERMQAGPTVPEMLLTKAEALARSGNWQEAMNYVNQLRQARIDKNADNIELTAEDQQDAVEKILEERHREMPFIMRWFDIRRLAYNEVTYDDVTLERDFYGVSDNAVDYSELDHYVLPVKSKRYAQPIVYTEITRSNHQIVQNEYDDNSVIVTKQETDSGYDDEDYEFYE